MIAFREERVIERCLSAFAPAFDELCLVIATGAAPEDRTAELAEMWCRENGKGFTLSRYQNRAHACGWKHVDNFAAARNASLRLAKATGADWWIWCDADDVIDAEGAARIRATAEAEMAKPEAERTLAWFADYDAPQPLQSVRFQRERLIHCSVSGEWIRPVHERFMVQHVRTGVLTGAVWQHAPLEKKERDDERNVRILLAEAGGAGESAWDISREASILHAHGGGDKWRGIADRYGRIALADPMLPKDARTETLCRLALTSTDTSEAKDLAWQAARFDPERRDGWCALAEIELSERQPFRALTFAYLASKLAKPPPPTGIPMHNLAYGWYGADVLMRAYRACAAKSGDRSYLEAAERIEDGFHAKARAQGEPVITILHATVRPEQAIKVRNKWLAHAAAAWRIEWIFGAEDNDDKALRTLWQHRVAWSSGRTCVAAWNQAALAARGEILVQMSDDWEPCAGWDALIAEAIGAQAMRGEQACLRISDGSRTDSLMCMAILTRARWEAQGREVFSGEYRGMYSDNEYSLRAKADGVIVDRPDIAFEHRHPLFGKGQWDEIYERNNHSDEYAHGLAVFERRNAHLLHP